MVKKRSSTINYGIQAESVNVDVGAFGPRAHAEKLVLSDSTKADVATTTSELRRAMKLHGVPSDIRTAAEKHLDNIELEAQKANPNKKKISTALKGVKSALDSAAEFTSDAVVLIKPLERIAQLVGVGLAAIGLS